MQKVRDKFIKSRSIRLSTRNIQVEYILTQTQTDQIDTRAKSQNTESKKNEIVKAQTDEIDTRTI